MTAIFRLLRLAFLTLCFWWLSNGAMAQPGDPGVDPDVPIDGGLGLLLAAGALYGSKKLYDARRRK